ncbi:alpha-amylase family glycosyl hydrolase [Chlorobaculum sp. MV4-Y]|uniref:alpha-amylase family glycosyl hydrolase n=1 Tax=Chlorobaculum sp. MV4-Y TaxID=2976335 RepID=UPI0021AE86E7|nr:alpha-amylase family glycosyl hydrolase [Chlorobaculum sp. MV4-Y]UWX56935.1 alpha-amylase family glycosyl hydrolase [Chlorobaculum sp. MV4-Y]
MPHPDSPALSPVERSLAEIQLTELTAGKTYYSSPSTWEDEVLYFLILDRFSDGREHGGFNDVSGNPVVAGETRTTPLFRIETDANNAEWQQWFEAGRGWCGGTIAGMRDKLGYLKRLGVTAIWVSPVFKQVTGGDSYHGYGIQNFLDVDPHFGTREELREFVAEAHQCGIRVILDIILNHAGDVFSYQDNQPYFYYEGRQWPVKGYRLNQGDSGSIPFGGGQEAHSGITMDAAIWPVEFQSEVTWTMKGEIRNWDAFPEFLEGDFCSLKDIDHGWALDDPAQSWDLERRISLFCPSTTLDHLIKVYRFWIAYADIDGFRLDTVKHMEPGAVRYFALGIHEFAQTLGKENFPIIGEITGGRSYAMQILDVTGLDAALGIGDLPDKLEFLAKGWRSPGNPETGEQEGYFDLFCNSLLDGKNSHQWYSKHIVTMIDDHDQVGEQRKYRFCGDSPESWKLLKAALGLNLATEGISCIYYGTEQAFNGADPRTGDRSWGDVFLRECMFGGPFGSLQSTGRHFFNEEHEVYRFVGRLAEFRKGEIALRRGRQYLRQVSATGSEGDFFYPQPVNGQMRWVVAWSRIFAETECLCAINTSLEKELTVWVVVDHQLNPPGKTMRCAFSSSPEQEGEEAEVAPICGSAVKITVPPGGFVIYR